MFCRWNLLWHSAKFKLFSISSDRINTDFTPICPFFFTWWRSRADTRQAGVHWDLHAIYDLACWTRSESHLQMIWSGVCVCACVQTFTECAGRCQAMPSDLTPSSWRWLSEELVWMRVWALLLFGFLCSESDTLTRLWTMTQITDPPVSWGKVSADLMNLNKQPLFLLFHNMGQSSKTKQHIILPQKIYNYLLKWLMFEQEVL